MTVGLPDDITASVVGRRGELRLLLSALERGKAVLLLGLPGVSKTTMVRALARHLGTEPDRFVDVTGDEQLTAACAGRDVRSPHGPAGRLSPGALHSRAPHPGHDRRRDPLRRGDEPGAQRGAERPADGAVRSLRRGSHGSGGSTPGTASPSSARPTRSTTWARPGCPAASPTGSSSSSSTISPATRNWRLSRCGPGPCRAGFHAFAVDVAASPRTSRSAARRVGARGHRLRRPAGGLSTSTRSTCPRSASWAAAPMPASSACAQRPNRTACEVVHELLDKRAPARLPGPRRAAPGARGGRRPRGRPRRSRRTGASTLTEEGEVALAGGGDATERAGDQPDEIPGLSRPGGSGEAGESRSVPMVGRDRPSAGGARPTELTESIDTHLRSLDEVLHRAREMVLSPGPGRTVHAGEPPGRACSHSGRRRPPGPSTSPPPSTPTWPGPRTSGPTSGC